MKYKKVPVKNMSIWQLGQAISEGGEFYDYKDELITIQDFELVGSTGVIQEGLAAQLGDGLITTREPIKWHDELPKLVRLSNGYEGLVRSIVENGKVSVSGFGYVYIEDCIPLTREEAAEFGV